MRVLADFAGRWHLHRRIEDRLGHGGRFEGEAEFLPEDGGGFGYVEHGTLLLSGMKPLHSERRYLWQEDAAGRIFVRFEDGRPFHDFHPGHAIDTARHHCAPDYYDVRYDFTHWPRWSAEWDVRGPRKDYRMESLYSR